MSVNSKKELRGELLKKRSSLSSSQLYKLSLALCDVICESVEYKNADTVLLYCATRGEPDLSSVAENALKSQKKVAYPISRTDTCTLDFKEIFSLNDLFEGAYGIFEPSDSAQTAILTEQTLCIVPALSVDQNGFRLGYGKGYYDRFLSTFIGTSACAVWSELLSKELPTDDTDIPIDIIITETGVVHLK